MQMEGVYYQMHASPLRDISRVTQHLSTLSCTHTALHFSCSCRSQDVCSNAAVSMHLNSRVLRNLQKRLMGNQAVECYAPPGSQDALQLY